MQRSFKQYSDRLEGDARQMTDDVIGLVSETQEFARAQLTVRPYTTLGMCAAIGYLLGAGLPRWLIRAAVPIVGRAVATSLTSAISSGIAAAGELYPDISSGHQKETVP